MTKNYLANLLKFFINLTFFLVLIGSLIPSLFLNFIIGGATEIDVAKNNLNSATEEREACENTYKSIESVINIYENEISNLLYEITVEKDNLMALQEKIDDEKIALNTIEEEAYKEVKLHLVPTFIDVKNINFEKLAELNTKKSKINTDEENMLYSLEVLNDRRKIVEEKQIELKIALSSAETKLSYAQAKEDVLQESYTALYKEYQENISKINSQFNSFSSYNGKKSDNFIYPVYGYRFISSPFGLRTLFGSQDNHIGIDIATGNNISNIYGKPISATKSGIVKKAIYSNTGYGNYIIIEHGNNEMSLYGHCSSLVVREGTFVSQGQTIAYVGSSGNSTGPHLHFEIRINGKPVNPQKFV